MIGHGEHRARPDRHRRKAPPVSSRPRAPSSTSTVDRDHPAGDSLVLFSTDSEPAVETTAPSPPTPVSPPATTSSSASPRTSPSRLHRSTCPATARHSRFSVSGTGTDTATIDPTGSPAPRRAPSPCSPRVSTTLMRPTRRTRWPPTISSVSRRSTSRRPSSRRRRSEERRTSRELQRLGHLQRARHDIGRGLRPRVPEGRVDPVQPVRLAGLRHHARPERQPPRRSGVHRGGHGQRDQRRRRRRPSDVLADNRTLSFTVGSNAAPMDISSRPRRSPNNAVDATVATLSTTDADATDTFTYSLVGGTGSTDNASFSIVGSSPGPASPSTRDEVVLPSGSGRPTRPARCTRRRSRSRSTTSPRARPAHALRHVGAVGTTLPRAGCRKAVGPSGSAEDGLSTGHGGPVQRDEEDLEGPRRGCAPRRSPGARRRADRRRRGARTDGDPPPAVRCDIEQDRLEGTPVGGASSSVSPTRG